MHTYTVRCVCSGQPQGATRSIKGLLMHKPAGHSTDISICMEANLFFFRGQISRTQQKLSACVIRCGVTETMLGVTVAAAVKAAVVLWTLTKKTSKPAEACRGFFSSPRAARVDLWWHRLWVISVGFDDSASWHQWETLTLLETLASPWQPGGHKARLRYDWPSANRYCWPDTSAAGAGGGWWGGNIAWLVIICRSENPSRCLPRGPALPSSPLIDPVAIVSNACAGPWECGRGGSRPSRAVLVCESSTVAPAQ